MSSPEYQSDPSSAEDTTKNTMIEMAGAVDLERGDLAQDINLLNETYASSLLANIQRDHPEIEERQYQIECLAILAQLRQSGHNRALVHMATGLGKTTVVAGDVKRYLEDKPEARVLFLCHQNQILRQARERFELIVGHEGHTYGNFTGESKAMHEVSCLFASFQTMKNWKQLFRPDEFDYIVVDESHHAKAETYEPTLKYFQPEFLLGLTATPDRQDLREIRDIFGHEVYSKSLAHALAEGLLARPDYRVILDEIQQNILKGVLEKENVSLAELNRTIFLPKRDEEIARLVQEKSSDTQDPKTIVFCPSISHAQRMANLLPDAATYHSEISRDEREKILRSFGDSSVKTLVSVDMFNEGMDIPDANVIVFLRSTQSETIFLQQLGRGLRKMANKNTVLILDFVANCDRLLMIEKLLHEAVSGHRTSCQPTEPKEIDEEYAEEDAELDLYSIDFVAIQQESQEARELGLGNFEFTETTRKILEIVNRIQTTVYEKAPEGWISVRSLALESGLARPTMYKAIHDLGMQPRRLRFGSQVGNGLSKSQVAVLMEHPLLKAFPMPEGWKPLKEFVEENNISYQLAYRILGELDVTLPTYKADGIRIQALSPEIQQELLSRQEVNSGSAPEGWLSVIGLAKALGKSPTTIQKYIDVLGVRPQLPRFKFGPKISVGLSPENQQLISGSIPGSELEELPEDYFTIPSLKKELGTTEATIRDVIQELGINTSKHRVKGHLAVSLSPDAKELLAKHPKFLVEPAPEGWVSVYDFATKNRTSKPFIIKIAGEEGIQFVNYKFFNHLALGVSPEDQVRILEILEKRRRR